MNIETSIGIIKLEFQKYNATIIEPIIKYDLKKICEIEFQYDGYNTVEEFNKNISSYIKVFDATIKKRYDILNSLYNNTLRFLNNWEEANGININNIDTFVSVYYIEIYENNVCIKASAWNPETDEELLGGHFIEAFLTLEQLESNKIDWQLS